MKINEITNEVMNVIATYMNDEVREDLHFDLAPCKNEEFIKAYIERCPDFAELLRNEFNIEI